MTLSPPSSNTLAKLAKVLDADDFRALPAKVTATEAGLVLSEIAGRDQNCPALEAAAFAEQLVGLYPAREVVNAKVFSAGLSALMAAFPRDMVKRVCDPVAGLPSRLKFFPSLADVREALDAEKTRRDRIAANARYVIAEHERLKAKAEQDAEFERNRPAAEDRKRRTDELLRDVTKTLSTASVSAEAWIDKDPKDEPSRLKVFAQAGGEFTVLAGSEQFAAWAALYRAAGLDLGHRKYLTVPTEWPPPASDAAA